MGARNDGAVTAAGNSVAFLKRKAPALFQRMKQLEVVLENASLFDHFMLVGRLKQIEELHGTFKTVHSELEKLDCDEIGSELADDFEEMFVTLTGIILSEITKRSTSVAPHPAFGQEITPAPFQVDSCAILEPIGLVDRIQCQSKHLFIVPAVHGGAGDDESYSKLDGGLDCINTGGFASDLVPAQATTSLTYLQALWIPCKRPVPADVHLNEPPLSAGGRNSGHRAGPRAVLGPRPSPHCPIGGEQKLLIPQPKFQRAMLIWTHHFQCLV
ncbi:uncharacterized protein LOC121405029 [Drosophila obscura]|uniref:uncharacterized protein LOC121405029 n=1 Tax=Drosophila obscura TaxID=7282 RepID=UPI001BB25A99|nr:uncharacterized protein LOC121405029 [Drosophila obscura]